MSKGVSILITGDTYLGGGRVKSRALNHDEKALFGDFLNTIENSDISITNLESPLVDEGEPMLKTGPNLKSPKKTLTVLKNAGFNLLTLANNHIMDYSKKGLISTLNSSSALGINTVGAGLNQKEACKPFIHEINGINIGIINITENEFSTTTDNSPGAHALNPVQNYYQIGEACKKAEYVIVIVHGGHEGYPLPSPRMKETYRFFIDAGASAVVGHHPHCYSGYEIYKNAPVFYSLGNFLFDKGNSARTTWNEGFIVKFIIQEDLKFDITPYIQNADKVGLRALEEEEYVHFKNKISQLNTIISDNNQLEKKFEEFSESSSNLYESYIEPYSNKYLHGLRNRELFPSLLSNRKKRLLLNLIRCEAHRDVLLKILQQ